MSMGAADYSTDAFFFKAVIRPVFLVTPLISVFFLGESLY